MPCPFATSFAPPYHAVPLQECAPKGIDVVMDMVGGEPFREALKVAKWGAHILFIGFATGDIPKASLQHFPPG